MNAELKKKWVRALRSGNYQQGKNNLHVTNGESGEDDKFCCLGVLCEVAGVKGEPDEYDAIVYYDGRDDMLSDVLLEWLELDDEDQDILAAANDAGDIGGAGPSEAWTFEEIADYIEIML